MNRLRAGPPGPLGKAIALIGGLALLVVGFLFSVVVLAVLAVVAFAVGGYVWWKTRALRRAMREARMRHGPPGTGAPGGDGRIIDGEVVVIAEADRVLSRPSGDNPPHA